MHNSKISSILRKREINSYRFELPLASVPAGIRRTVGLSSGGRCGISTDGDPIVLASHQDSCLECGGTSDLTAILNRKVCGTCAESLRSSGWSLPDT